MVIKSVTT